MLLRLLLGREQLTSFPLLCAPRNGSAPWPQLPRARLGLAARGCRVSTRVPNSQPAVARPRASRWNGGSWPQRRVNIWLLCVLCCAARSCNPDTLCRMEPRSTLCVQRGTGSKLLLRGAGCGAGLGRVCGSLQRSGVGPQPPARISPPSDGLLAPLQAHQHALQQPGLRCPEHSTLARASMPGHAASHMSPHCSTFLHDRVQNYRSK